MSKQGIKSRKLQQLAREIKTNKTTIKSLFNTEKNRLNHLIFQEGPIYVDCTKNLINSDIHKELIQLAKDADVQVWAKRMFSGEKINLTEKRAVLHIALRNIDYKNGHFMPRSSIHVDNKDIMPEVCETLNRMATFTDRIRYREWKGATGKAITHIINIGIGGSDLGPKMITHALLPYQQKGIDIRFVSNVDGSDIVENLKGCNPETTLFIIASKTFTTQETMTNANSAKEWFLNKMKKADIPKHFVAASTAEELVVSFGIDPEDMFPFWDWVGGRYSSPSAIGLPVMLSIGKEKYAELLTGYHAMDEHFLNTAYEKNIPVQLALIGIWYNNFMGFDTHALLPYDHYLKYFPAYFQQGDRESNGKYVNREGKKVDYQTGPIIWGEPGTNGQHSFYQLIHHGTKIVPADFIGFIKTHNPLGDHHQKLMANYFAQTEALMNGLSADQLVEQGCPEELIPHRSFEGNRPTNSILIDSLTPYSLGMLIAMYEHKIFTQGIIWNINSFDQYGVELGKVGAKQILSEIKSKKVDNHDVSTMGLMKRFIKSM